MDERYFRIRSDSLAINHTRLACRLHIRTCFKASTQLLFTPACMKKPVNSMDNAVLSSSTVPITALQLENPPDNLGADAGSCSEDSCNAKILVVNKTTHTLLTAHNRKLEYPIHNVRANRRSSPKDSYRPVRHPQRRTK